MRMNGERMTEPVATSEDEWEQATLEHLGELGWTVRRGPEIAPGTDERDRWDDLAIPSRMFDALRRLNLRHRGGALRHRLHRAAPLLPVGTSTRTERSSRPVPRGATGRPSRGSSWRSTASTTRSGPCSCCAPTRPSTAGRGWPNASRSRTSTSRQQGSGDDRRSRLQRRQGGRRLAHAPLAENLQKALQEYSESDPAADAAVAQEAPKPHLAQGDDVLAQIARDLVGVMRRDVPRTGPSATTSGPSSGPRSSGC